MEEGRSGSSVIGDLPLHLKMGNGPKTDATTELGKGTSDGWPWEEGSWKPGGLFQVDLTRTGSSQPQHSEGVCHCPSAVYSAYFLLLSWSASTEGVPERRPHHIGPAEAAHTTHRVVGQARASWLMHTA